MRASRAGEVMAFRKVFFHIGTFFKVCHKKTQETNNNQKPPLNLTKIVVLIMVTSISNCLYIDSIKTFRHLFSSLILFFPF